MRKNIIYILLLTTLFEAVTLFFRFGLGLESTQNTSALAAWTFGFRVHHGYIGAGLIGLAYVLPESKLKIWTARFGWALLGSDLIHHFLVLWPMTGSPHFDIRYPE